MVSKNNILRRKIELTFKNKEDAIKFLIDTLTVGTEHITQVDLFSEYGGDGVYTVEVVHSYKEEEDNGTN